MNETPRRPQEDDENPDRLGRGCHTLDRDDDPVRASVIRVGLGRDGFVGHVYSVRLKFQDLQSATFVPCWLAGRIR